MKSVLKLSLMIPLLLLVLVILIWAIGSYLAIARIEEPQFTVKERIGKLELREYDPYIVAETTVSGTMQSGLNSGFQIIANYIFGDNTSRSDIAMTTPVVETDSEKIAMTAPVLESDTDASRTVAFVMPSEFTLDSLPLPNDDRIVIREEPARILAVLRFGWYGTEERVEQKKQELLELVQEAGLEAKGGIQSAFYNPPLSFPLLLRNEVWVEVSS